MFRAIKFLIVVFLALFTLDSALAGTIAKVRKKKRTVFVQGVEPADGLQKGGDACIFDGDTQIACGKVVRVNGKRAIVKIKDKKAMAKIKKGMTVMAGESSGDGGTGEGGKEKEGPDNPVRIWLAFSPGLNPGNYNKIYYDTLPDTSISKENFDGPDEGFKSADSLWTSEAAASFSLIGLVLQAGFPIGSRAATVGFRYRLFDEAPIDSNYSTDPDEGNIFARTERSASALGLYADFQYLRIVPSKSMNFDLSAGLDYDMSTVTVVTTRKDDNGVVPEVTLVDAKSSASTISLRLGAGVDFRFVDSFGLHVGAHLLIPLTASTTTTATFNDENAERLPGGKEALADLESALGHTKSSFGLDLLIGALVAF